MNNQLDATQRREYLSKQLNNLIRDLPPKYQERYQQHGFRNQLISSLLDGTVFSIVQGLQEIQSLAEKNLSNERNRLVKITKEQENDLIRKHREDEQRCADRPQHLNLLQAANKRELEAFLKRTNEEQQRFDMKVILELDQKVLEQQTTLEKAGVPFMYATNKPNDVRLQMFTLEFIQKLSQSLPPSFNL